MRHSLVSSILWISERFPTSFVCILFFLCVFGSYMCPSPPQTNNSPTLSHPSSLLLRPPLKAPPSWVSLPSPRVNLLSSDSSTSPLQEPHLAAQHKCLFWEPLAAVSYCPWTFFGKSGRDAVGLHLVRSAEGCCQTNLTLLLVCRATVLPCCERHVEFCASC